MKGGQGKVTEGRVCVSWRGFGVGGNREGTWSTRNAPRGTSLTALLYICILREAK